jgi:hypothetical protein
VPEVLRQIEMTDDTEQPEGPTRKQRALLGKAKLRARRKLKVFDKPPKIDDSNTPFPDAPLWSGDGSSLYPIGDR